MLMVMLMSSTLMRVRWNDFSFGYQVFQFSAVVMLVIGRIGIGVLQDPLGLLLGLFFEESCRLLRVSLLDACV